MDDLNAQKPGTPVTPATTGTPAEEKDENTEILQNLKDIGNRIKSIRKELRLRQIEMAEKLNTSHSYISAVENGRTSPGHRFFFKFSTLFDVNLNYLFHGKGEMFLPDGIHPTPPDDHTSLYEPLPEEIKDINDLTWFMNKSPMFLHYMISQGFGYLLRNKDTVTMDIALQMKKKKNKNLEEKWAS